MMILRDDDILLDSKKLKLNLGMSFDDYRSAKEKLIKSESNNYDDSYVYRTGRYEGYSTVITVIVNNSKYREVVDAFYNGNKIVLPKETKYRKYYIDGEMKIFYYPEFTKLEIPLYLKAGCYTLGQNGFSLYNVPYNRSYNIVSPSDMDSDAVFEIRGNGTLIFEVNNIVIKLRNAKGGYKLDCTQGKQNIYDLDNNLKNVTSEFSGVFPVIKPGNNKILLISGDSMKVNVEWRWKQ